MRVEESGSFEVAADPGTAMDWLTDEEAVPGCLPGEVHAVEPREDGGVTVEFTASHGGASKDVRVRFRVAEADREAGRVAYTGQGLASRAKVDIEGAFSLSPLGGDGAAGEGDDGPSAGRADADGRTRVEWEGAADLGGVLSSLNRAVAVSAVREKLAETAENVRLELDAAAE